MIKENNHSNEMGILLNEFGGSRSFIEFLFYHARTARDKRTPSANDLFVLVRFVFVFLLLNELKFSFV